MESDLLKKEWYVIRVQSRDEEKVKDFLLANSFLAKVLYRESFYKKEGKVIKSNQLLFPGYIFVISDLNPLEFDQEIIDLRFKYGKYFKNLKYDNEGTSALKDEEKRFLSHLLGEKEVVETSEGFIEGDQVVITDGPLSGLESSIKYINRHKKLAKLEVPFMGSTREVTVPLEIIYKK